MMNTGRPEEVVHGDCCELEAALRCGNAVRAVEIARRLAEQRTKISVEISDSPVKPPETLISVNICIEDRYCSGVCVPLKIAPSTTFQTLCQMMYERFEFPLEVQQWIAQKQKKIHNLNASLSNFGIRDGDTIHLYLLPASAANVTKEKAQETYERAFHAPVPHFRHEISGQPTASTSAGNQTENDLYVSAPSRETSVLDNIGSVTEKKTTRNVGWSCPRCTYLNEATRPGCVVCGSPRPDDYQIPIDYIPTEAERLRITTEQDLLSQLEVERQANRERLLSVEQQPLVANLDSFTCQICFDNIAHGDGVLLRECLHTFCRGCLCGHIEAATNSAINCPFNDGSYSCTSLLQEREIRALVSDDVYIRLLALSVQEAESREGRSFHCQTPDCRGWCIYEDDVNTFDCPVCGVANCLTCKAQHAGETCRQYQDGLKARAAVDHGAKQTQKIIERMLRKGNAMHCPTCQIVVMKKDGCDWIRCSMCKTEICWVTKGPRWGPDGEGDESGGCHCGRNGQLCHPKCQNCH